MADLTVFVDFDNVQAIQIQTGVVAFSRMLVSQLPSTLLSQYDNVFVRLYGGWRSKGLLTRGAQRIIPDIRSNSGGVLQFLLGEETRKVIVHVALAYAPIGFSTPLDETLVFDRDLRKFRAKSQPWSECANATACGLAGLSTLCHTSQCQENNCAMKLGDLLVRDEQKMVDTLIVADIAHDVHVDRARDLVVVSSDTDMWPGVLLALRAGCSVTHIHPKKNWRTQAHLMRTLNNQLQNSYKQMSL